ncbi:unnamed protein product [Lampetra planeri]
MQTESIVEAAREYYAELYGSKTLESGARDCFLGEVKQKIKAPEEMNKQIQMEELDEATTDGESREMTEVRSEHTLRSRATDDVGGEIADQRTPLLDEREELETPSIEGIKAEESIGCMFYPLLKEDLPILSPIYIALKKK